MNTDRDDSGPQDTFKTGLQYIIDKINILVDLGTWTEMILDNKTPSNCITRFYVFVDPGIKTDTILKHKTPSSWITI